MLCQSRCIVPRWRSAFSPATSFSSVATRFFRETSIDALDNCPSLLRIFRLDRPFYDLVTLDATVVEPKWSHTKVPGARPQKVYLFPGEAGAGPGTGLIFVSASASAFNVGSTKSIVALSRNFWPTSWALRWMSEAMMRSLI